MLDQAVIVLFIVLLLIAAVSDFRTFRIPNRLCGLIGLLFIVHGFAAPAPFDWIGGITAGASLLGAGVVLFAMGAVGGGDVKLLAVTALWSGWWHMPMLLIGTAMVGGLVALGALMSRAVMRPAAAMPNGGPSAGSPAKEGVPYGIAIAAGGMIVAGRLIAG